MLEVIACSAAACDWAAWRCAAASRLLPAPRLGPAWRCSLSSSIRVPMASIRRPIWSRRVAGVSGLFTWSACSGPRQLSPWAVGAVWLAWSVLLAGAGSWRVDVGSARRRPRMRCRLCPPPGGVAAGGPDGEHPRSCPADGGVGCRLARRSVGDACGVERLPPDHGPDGQRCLPGRRPGRWR